ncbi:DUF475 domain-containing protein [Formicincola oecophyllae]|uniref:DUF475 domain-containing protein n=1 Tax=Formicincola oecophyllae TaxID=2558361 RepID=A0A4Y6U8H5_9PROT|nr:DUF475 domain-containing protein [Formicincola oecophyllae]QDH13290.1 DUF475 domain-containing protein [Formicincola oecophyllae]
MTDAPTKPQPSSWLKIFGSSIAVCVLALAAAGWVGWQEASGGHAAHVQATLSALASCALLGVLEVSLSFDNAVANATVLRRMTRPWQDAFMTLGMLVAVFGMRLVFPLAIVAVAGHVSMRHALMLALHDPARYGTILASAHDGIMGFGGAFLMMVGLNFFFHPGKHLHWLGWLERPARLAGGVPCISAITTLLLLLIVKSLLPPSGSSVFLSAGCWGIVLWGMVEGVNHLLGAAEPESAQGKSPARGGWRKGLGLFLYLEVLDASFSFDGVIGAFALSNNLLIIALGLGMGAMVIRALTLMLVERGVLENFPYLEHGAFWAITVLAAIMMVSTRLEVPDIITGTMSALIIGASLLSSIKAKAKGATSP